MTKEQKLKKIIEYAIMNNYQGIHLVEYALGVEGHLGDLARYGLLFSHDFAKAVFGEKRAGAWIAWKWHLRQAVISKDPINYYYQFIKEKQK